MRRTLGSIVLLLLVTLGLAFAPNTAARAADATPDVAAPAAAGKITVLAREGVVPVEHAIVQGDDLLIGVESVTAVTGFELKPQGLCAGEVCIAMPPDEAWVTDQSGQKYFNVTRFAKKIDQQFAADAQKKVWSFSAVPLPEASPLVSGQAPDFALEDVHGKTVRLSDYRGKKVLVLTWASWCGCRYDLAGWQKIFEELEGKNFQIIAAAQDTGGMKVAGPWYERAHVTFAATVDPKHTVSSLYQMVNVPTGVWIDEAGQIVRGSEVAYSKQQKVLGQTIGDDRYVAGVRDWVEKGKDSRYVLSPEKLKSSLTVRSPQERLADAHFKLAVYFSEAGNQDAAKTHWQQAQQLNPDSWNYHRQQWSFNKTTEMTNWLAKVRKLGDKPYYAPVEFPADAK